MNSQMIRIGDFATVVAGGTPSRGVPSYFGGTIPWVKTLDLNFSYITSTEEKITNQALSSIRGSINPVGSVMVAMYGGEGTIGKTGILGLPAVTNQAIASILPKPKTFDSVFLHFQLMQLRPKWMSFSQGNRKDPNINKEVVKNMFVWLPDIAVQRRIAATIMAQLAEVDKARQATEAQLNEVAKLADAIIFDSIRRGAPKKHSLGDVLAEVKIGIGKDWADYPVMGATRNGLAPAREQPGKNPRKYKPVFPGTVFYNPMRILIGSIAFVDEDDTPGITSPDYVALRGRKGMVDSRWFYYWLRSPLGEQCINSLARGAVRERMLFNRLAEGEIELPGYDVQQSAAQALAALKPMRRAIAQMLKEIKLMPTKILAQAFPTPTGVIAP